MSIALGIGDAVISHYSVRHQHGTPPLPVSETTKFATVPGTSIRAKRFPVQTPVAYRERGESIWSPGRSVNVSRTGMLFETDRPTVVGATIELVLEFEAPLATVACSGRVVRAAANEGGPWAIAATISRYSLLPNLDQNDE